MHNAKAAALQSSLETELKSTLILKLYFTLIVLLRDLKTQIKWFFGVFPNSLWPNICSARVTNASLLQCNHVTLLAIIRCTHLTHVLHRITALACYSALVLQCSPSGDWILELFILPGSLPCNTWSLLLHYLDCLLQKHIFKVGRGKKSWWNWQDEAKQESKSLFQRLGDDLKHCAIEPPIWNCLRQFA